MGKSRKAKWLSYFIKQTHTLNLHYFHGQSKGKTCPAANQQKVGVDHVEHALHEPFRHNSKVDLNSVSMAPLMLQFGIAMANGPVTALIIDMHTKIAMEYG